MGQNNNDAGTRSAISFEDPEGVALRCARMKTAKAISALRGASFSRTFEIVVIRELRPGEARTPSQADEADLMRMMRELLGGDFTVEFNGFGPADTEDGRQTIMGAVFKVS